MRLQSLTSASVLLLALVSCSDTTDQGTGVTGPSSTSLIETASTSVSSSELSQVAEITSSTPSLPASSLSTDSLSSSQASASPTELAAPGAAELFARAIANNSPGATQYAAPGSNAFVYAEGADLIGASHPGLSKAAITQIDGGWKMVNAGTAEVTLTDFVVDPATGLVQSLKRNGVSIDGTVVAGDGREYVSVPDEYSDWTGSVTGKVHSYRLFDGALRIVSTTKNDSSAKAEFRFDSYAGGGQQFEQIYSDETLPGLSRTAQQLFEGAPGGGKAYGHVWVDGGGSVEVVVDVPALG